MTYDEWNDLLAAHFFKPSAAGRAVRLNVTRQLLDDLGAAEGANFGDFVSAVREGHGVGGVTVCLRAAHALELWNDRRVLRPQPRYPLYFGYLCFLVLAAGEGDFSDVAYYPRLRRLLGEDEEIGSYPHIEKTLALWLNLQYWANKEKRGEWGLFHVVRRGNHPYVSLPRAQVLLSDRIRQRLREIFLVADIDPDRRPARSVIASRIREFGRDIPASLLKLLGTQGELREYLLDDIEDELDRFDPDSVEVVAPAELPTGSGRARTRSTDLAICLEVEPPRVRCRARFRLSCEVSETDLETGLSFALTDGGERVTVTCGGRFPGWSSILELAPGVAWDVSTINWGVGHEFRGLNQALRIRTNPSDIRIFTSGLTDGLPGFVEAAVLPSFGECFIATGPGKRGAILAWGQQISQTSGNVSPREIIINTGLPAHWSLFYLERVPSAQEARAGFPGETAAENIHLMLRGGIRAPGLKSRYFSFAPPRVLLSGNCAGAEVRMCGHVCLPESTGTFSVPQALCEPGVEVEVNVSRQGNVLAVRRFELISDGGDGHAADVRARFGRDGSLLLDSEGSAACAGCRIFDVPLQPTTASNDVDASEVIARQIDALANEIRTVFGEGSHAWTDPGGNRFTVLHRFESFCLDTVGMPSHLPITKAAIQKAGYEFRELISGTTR